MSKKNNKELFLQAGINLLARKGYADMGIQEILALTELPRASFYHHFASKEQFAVETVQHLEKRHTVTTLELLTDAKTTPLQRIKNYFQHCSSDVNIDLIRTLLVSLSEFDEKSPLFTAALVNAQSSWLDAIATCLEEAKVEGELPESTDVGKMAEFFLCSWQGAMMKMVLSRNPEILSKTIEFLLIAASPK